MVAITSHSLPKVSVVVASFNQVALLKRALESVLSQTYPNLEIIIVDDGSSDGSHDYIKNMARDYPEKVSYFLQEQNVGIPRNKNTGFKRASGELITYLDGDDTYYPQKVEKEVEVFLAQPAYSVVYSNFDIKQYSGEVVKTWANSPDLPQGKIIQQVVSASFPGQHMPRFEMFRKEAMYDLGFYDESFPIYEDLDFMLRYSAKYLVGFTPNVGSSYYMNPSSIVSSTKQWKMTQLHRKVYAKNKHIFYDNKLEEEYEQYMKRSAIDLLYSPPSIRLSDYLACILSQPSKSVEVFKALYYSIRQSR